MRAAAPLSIRYAVLSGALVGCGGLTAGAQDTGEDAGPRDVQMPSDAPTKLHDATTERTLEATTRDASSPDACSQPVEVPFASCKVDGPGTTHCGASGDNCCTSLPVLGGPYDRTYARTYDGGLEGGADPATVSSFRLDKYLVTVGRFRTFVEAWNGGAGYLPPAGSGKHTHLNQCRGLALASSPTGRFELGWDPAFDSMVSPTDANLACSGNVHTWTNASGDNEDLPINCANWYEAYAFCIWDGGFLPSEAEWEYAAAGGGEQRAFPWGSTLPGIANVYAVYGCLYPAGTGKCRGATNFAPVGTATLGGARFGQLDLAGEIMEWTSDYYVRAYSTPCDDCAELEPAEGLARALRGGDFATPVTWLAPSFRMSFPPDARYGFRCARAP